MNPPEKIKPMEMEWWNKTIPEHEAAKQMQATVAFFAARLSKPDEAKIETIFYSAMQDAQEQPVRRAYAVTCLQALDAVEYLADSINDDSFIVRSVGIREVQHWTGLAPERDLQFYKILIDRENYSADQATAAMQLMHPMKPEDQQKPEIVAALFDAMRHDKIAVRELAYLHLSYSDPAGAKEVGFFDAAADEGLRDPVLQKWKASWKRRFIDKKK
jgi:hypothetical protein